ncbi:MAG: hypothetical protein LAT77_06805 [Aliidiomarina sp.]|uniref:hypothetical protein n=1 Tax=Aliidiomarina sp. TaxID=1872439 RepID=UPI0025C0A693|nr:hypothetical protein [Aliidiomarina sp.]MCH8501605.1 hypothetical protein [Aliidiomarina sp.]
MKLASINFLILASSLTIAPLTANALIVDEGVNAHDDNIVQLTLDVNGNYHISFDAAADLVTSTAEHEEHDIVVHQSSTSMRVNGLPTTTEDRINGFVSAVRYFTEDSPRSFSLTPSPNRERMDTEEYGEVQHYDFCIYFRSGLRTTACTRIWFAVDEMNLTFRFDAAEIEYEVNSKLGDVSEGGPSEGFFFDPNLLGSLHKQFIEAPSYTSDDDDGWPDPTPEEYANWVMESLRALCGDLSEYCIDYGVHDRYIESTGAWEVFGWYEGYTGDTGGTAGSFYDHLPAQFDRPLNNTVTPPPGPPGGQIDL